MIRALGLLIVLALAVPASAHQPPPPPPPPPPAMPAMAPTLLMTKLVDGGLIVTVQEMVPVREKVRVKEIAPDGQVVEKEIEVTVNKTVFKQVVRSLKGAKVTDVAGKPITEEKVAELLKKETVVVVSFWGDIAEEYRKPFKDGTVFIVFPPPVEMPRKEPVPIPAPEKPKG